jgi:hypothetical protein
VEAGNTNPCLLLAESAWAPGAGTLHFSNSLRPRSTHYSKRGSDRLAGVRQIAAWPTGSGTVRLHCVCVLCFHGMQRFQECWALAHACTHRFQNLKPVQRGGLCRPTFHFGQAGLGEELSHHHFPRTCAGVSARADLFLGRCCDFTGNRNSANERGSVWFCEQGTCRQRLASRFAPLASWALVVAAADWSSAACGRLRTWHSRSLAPHLQGRLWMRSFRRRYLS